MASSSARAWGNEDLLTLDLGDERRNRRARQIIERFAQRPGASIPSVFGNRAETEATYRLLSNDAVEPAAIVAALQRATVDRLGVEAVVLVPQDTTCLDFRSHRAVEGLGPTGGGDGSAGHGIFVHSAIAVSANGVPLGLLHQHSWARDIEKVGQQNRKQRPLQDKESYRWLQTARAVESAVPQDKQLVQIADREGDIFELFAQPRRRGSHLLVRAYRSRRLQDEGARLWPTVGRQPAVGEFEMLVPDGGQRAVRKARLELRYSSVTVQPPRHGVHDPSMEPVALNAIEVRERDAPEGESPVLWRLLTDLSVDSVDEAMCCVRYYGMRWLIERYHYVLKSGCRIEESQLRAVDRLERLVALLSAVALRLLWMTYSARVNGDTPCTVAFSNLEWRLLYQHYLPGPPPLLPPPLRDAALWLARLGGFLGRKGDGEPGVKVLWRGLMRLHDIVAGFLLASRDVRNE